MKVFEKWHLNPDLPHPTQQSKCAFPKRRYLYSLEQLSHRGSKTRVHQALADALGRRDSRLRRKVRKVDMLNTAISSSLSPKHQQPGCITSKQKRGDTSLGKWTSPGEKSLAKWPDGKVHQATSSI